jgi:hypothetical protein
MKKILSCVAILFFCTLEARTLHSQQHNKFDFRRGNDVLSSCTDEDAVVQQACEAYIMGVQHGYSLATGLNVPSIPADVKLCIPEGVTRRLEIDAVLKGLKEHPENRQWDSEILIARYLIDAWPCKQN